MTPEEQRRLAVVEEQAQTLEKGLDGLAAGQRELNKVVVAVQTDVSWTRATLHAHVEKDGSGGNGGWGKIAWGGLALAITCVGVGVTVGMTLG